MASITSIRKATDNLRDSYPGYETNQNGRVKCKTNKTSDFMLRELTDTLYSLNVPSLKVAPFATTKDFLIPTEELFTIKDFHKMCAVYAWYKQISKEAIDHNLNKPKEYAMFVNLCDIEQFEIGNDYDSIHQHMIIDNAIYQMGIYEDKMYNLRFDRINKGYKLQITIILDCPAIMIDNQIELNSHDLTGGFAINLTYNSSFKAKIITDDEKGADLITEELGNIVAFDFGTLDNVLYFINDLIFVYGVELEYNNKREDFQLINPAFI